MPPVNRKDVKEIIYNASKMAIMFRYVAELLDKELYVTELQTILTLVKKHQKLLEKVQPLLDRVSHD